MYILPVTGEVDDLSVDLEKEKTAVNSLQSQQKKFDATLAKERERSDRLEGTFRQAKYTKVFF